MHLPTKVTKLAVEIPAEVADMFPISANMEGVVPRLPQIKIIHAGGLFQMPDETKPDMFEGVIIDKHSANAWWEKPASETGVQAPDCFSMDGVTPVEECASKQSDSCSECAQNQYGSDKKGKGKACKNMRRVHIIVENSVLPRRLSVGPTSLSNFDAYVTSLYDSGLPYACVVTQFSLETKTADGNTWSIIKPSRGRVLAGEELVSVAGYIKKYRDASRKQEIKSDEYFDTTFDTEEMDKTDIPY